MAVKITGLVIVLENWKSIVCLETKGRYNLPFQKPLKVVLEQKCVSQTCNGWSNEGTLKLKYEQHRHHEIRTLVIKLFMHRKHCLNKYMELDALLMSALYLNSVRPIPMMCIFSDWLLYCWNFICHCLKHQYCIKRQFIIGWILTKQIHNNTAVVGCQVGSDCI